MLNIKNLERRWLKYKILSYLPYIATFFLSLSILVGISMWMHSNKSVIKQDNNTTYTTTVLSKPTRPTAIEENTTFIEPSMEFVQSFQNTPSTPEVTPPHTTTMKKLIQQPINTVLTAPKTITMPEYSPPPATVATPSKTSSNNQSLSINRDESKLDIDSLIQRFKETSNANLGLFIARYYYDHGNYNEAYNYALKTNNSNNRIDESWIIFAKTLVKLGKPDQAKKTLQFYISQSNSENAKGLLDAIENGSFK
ncbi:MAG: CDC27 family protein [Sulfuricurvum sp.]|uniref:tetratricopeptide repeat protein n=1 Tax=Sulfuricurvum sp. TaxID=2025608 RepID=UPI00262D6B49|nr:CDC27 family protein [Sulfuricurvum sp.]MDD5160353.1 CDC27 family protein [Sulfuricurvum sp.]